MMEQCIRSMARCCRRDQRVQFSGGGGRGTARSRLRAAIAWCGSRRKTPLTALASSRAVRSRRCAFQGPKAGRCRRSVLGHSRPRRRGRGLVDDARGLDFRDRLHAHGPRGGRACRATLCKTILELGGNNAMIVAPSADVKMALPRFFFPPLAPQASVAPHYAA